MVTDRMYFSVCSAEFFNFWVMSSQNKLEVTSCAKQKHL